MPKLPLELSINAWTGRASDSISETGSHTEAWALSRQFDARKFLPAEEPADRRDWRDERVGWGLVLPDNEKLPSSELATANDAPEPIQRLWKSRPDSPVFRYNSNLPTGLLRRNYPDRQPQRIAMAGAPRGTGEGRLPRYILIYGTPSEIPWAIQFMLNTVAFVGRLDLQGEALRNYVDALLNDWSCASCAANRPVVWSVDHGGNDITRLMRESIAEPIAERLDADDKIDAREMLLVDSQSTKTGLIDALRRRNPALVVTTSHGMTGPLDDPDRMASQLGCLVDRNREALLPHELVADWAPDGAIWYAHACCSAGSDSRSSYAELFAPGAPIRDVLTSIAAIGARTAPLPRALLGCRKPLRAFIGHVEPTFDWTLQQKETGQLLTEGIVESIYDHIYRLRPEPVGMAFRSWYEPVGSLLSQWVFARDQVGDEEAAGVALGCNLTAIDRISTVVLGDPTVAIPPLIADTK